MVNNKEKRLRFNHTELIYIQRCIWNQLGQMDHKLITEEHNILYNLLKRISKPKPGSPSKQEITAQKIADLLIETKDIFQPINA